MNLRRLLVSLAATSLLVAPVPGQDAKAAKEKDKAKAKPAARSFTDEDLKKYQDKAQDDAPAAESGTPQESPSPRSETERGPMRWQTRAPESSGAREASPSAEAAAAKSPEEAEWKGRAAEARRPASDAQSRIAGIEAEMAQLKERLNPMSTNYVLGGTSTAGVDAILEIEEKLQNLETQRVGAKTELAEAEQGWQRFLEEARVAGASPAWLNP